MGENLVSDSFIKNRNWTCLWNVFWTCLWNVSWTCLWIDSLKCCDFLFILCPTRAPPKYIKIKVLTTCFYFAYAFLKNKKSSGTNLPASICARFLRKIFLTLHSFNGPNFSCLYLLRYWAICVL